MNKRIGYLELKVGDQIIPIKFGMYAMDLFCAEYGIKFQDNLSIFEDNSKGTGLIPKELLKFLSIAVRSGANYAAEVEGKGVDFYSKFQVYDWIDELGINSIELTKVLYAFIKANLNGGVFEEMPDLDIEEVDSKIKKKDTTLTT